MDAGTTQPLYCVLWVLSGSRANNFLMAGGKDFHNLTIMFRELAHGTTVCRHFGISCLSGFSSFPPPTAVREGKAARAKANKINGFAPKWTAALDNWQSQLIFNNCCVSRCCFESELFTQGANFLSLQGTFYLEGNGLSVFSGRCKKQFGRAILMNYQFKQDICSYRHILVFMYV